MELLDRYLQAVKTFLPKSRQNDILKELSENILSQMEDKEAELGRPLNEDEQAAIIKQHGHPMTVASRYRSRQQLIGPTMFPAYWFVLKAALLGAFAVYVVIATIAALIGPDPIQQIVQTFLRFPGVALYVFAWMTLTFAALDMVEGKFRSLDKWNPRSLPPVMKYADRIPRLNSALELVFGGIALMFLWSAAPRFSYLTIGTPIGDWHLSSAWHALVVPVTLLMLAGMAQACVNLIRPHWTQFRSTVRLITAGGALVILYFLLNAGDLVVLRGTNALGHGDVVQIVNRVLFYILVATAIAYAVDALWQIRRLIVQSSKFRGLGGFKTCV